MRPLMIAGAVAVVAAPAAASTPAAWKKLKRQAERSCIEASNFRRPRVSNMVVFEDQVGVVAILVTGMFRQPRLQGASGTDLCLYNRRTGKVVREEAKGWGERR